MTDFDHQRRRIDTCFCQSCDFRATSAFSRCVIIILLFRGNVRREVEDEKWTCDQKDGKVVDASIVNATNDKCSFFDVYWRCNVFR